MLLLLLCTMYTRIGIIIVGKNAGYPVHVPTYPSGSVEGCVYCMRCVYGSV